MKIASISTAKNQLSALIEQVRQGETILITDHDRPVAKLLPVAAESGPKASGELALLERKGIIRRGNAERRRLRPVRPAEGVSALTTLLEERNTAR